MALSTPAQAQSAGDKAAAEALFDEGRKLMQEGKLEPACRKFEASQRLDPAPGTLLNEADCWEKLGRTASAWVSFREAAALARNAGDTKRASAATQRAAALEPKLARLKITVPDAVRSTSGLTVKRDGEKVDAALWDSPIPVDAWVSSLGPP
ncbi:MAG TPA: hypothetical protein VGJ84_22005 [Polyangiaceae bacterium]